MRSRHAIREGRLEDGFGIRRARGLSLVGMLILSSAASAAAQTAPAPGGKDPVIVINPTIEECNRGWDSESLRKWPKLQFDQFCAVLKAPTEVINPTLEECAKGWSETVRWTRQEFERFCDNFKKSK